MTSQCIARRDLPRRAWNDFVQAHPEGWFFHTSAWLDYALAYTPGAIDHSNAVIGPDGRIRAVCPAMCQPNQAPCYGGQMAVPPLLAPDAGLVVHIGGHPKLRVAYRPGVHPEDEPGDGFRCGRVWTYVADLWDGDEKRRWGRLRRSYKHLVRAAEKAWDIVVLSRVPREEAWTYMQQALALHTVAAGRQTRSEETWQIQADWMSAGYGVLAMAYSHGKVPVGFAYAIRYKDWSYYCSGATAEKNLQHALQWRLMQALAADGVTQYYELGHDAEPGEDEKARSIAFFKSGFGGERVPVAVMEAS